MFFDGGVREALRGVAPFRLVDTGGGCFAYCVSLPFQGCEFELLVAGDDALSFEGSLSDFGSGVHLELWDPDGVPVVDSVFVPFGDAGRSVGRLVEIVAGEIARLGFGRCENEIRFCGGVATDSLMVDGREWSFCEGCAGEVAGLVDVVWERGL